MYQKQIVLVPSSIIIEIVKEKYLPKIWPPVITTTHGGAKLIQNKACFQFACGKTKCVNKLSLDIIYKRSPHWFRISLLNNSTVGLISYNLCSILHVYINIIIEQTLQYSILLDGLRRDIINHSNTFMPTFEHWCNYETTYLRDQIPQPI